MGESTDNLKSSEKVNGNSLILEGLCIFLLDFRGILKCLRRIQIESHKICRLGPSDRSEVSVLLGKSSL